MNAKWNILLYVFTRIVFVLVVITFIITSLSLPNNAYLTFDFKNMEFTTNINYGDIWEEIVKTFKTFAQGSLGKSNKYKAEIDIWDLVKPSIGNSLKLLSASLILSVILGMTIGIFSCEKVNKITSKILGFLISIFSSMPSVFTIVILQFLAIWLFNNNIKILPAGGFGKGIRYLVLPVTALSLLPTMYIAKLTANSINELYRHEFITTAMGKGASKVRIVLIHILKNTIVEISGAFSFIASILISTLILVEYLFWYPGMTYMMFKQLEEGEIQAVVGIALLFGVLYFAIDIFFKGIKYILNTNKVVNLK